MSVHNADVLECSCDRMTTSVIWKPKCLCSSILWHWERQGLKQQNYNLLLSGETKFTQVFLVKSVVLDQRRRSDLSAHDSLEKSAVVAWGVSFNHLVEGLVVALQEGLLHFNQVNLQVIEWEIIGSRRLRLRFTTSSFYCFLRTGESISQQTYKNSELLGDTTHTCWNINDT